MNIRQDPIVVLHVDDDPQVSGLVSDYFEREHERLTVITANSAAEALDELHDGVDCIVSDYDMPQMDGLDLLEEVRQIRPDLPFILLTGMGSEELASEAITAGVTDYFRKSTDLESYAILARRIKNVVRRRRAEVGYRELFEKAAEGFALHDPETGGFVEANDSLLATLGLDREQLLTMTLDDLPTIPPQDEQEVTLAEHLQRAVADGTTVLEEYCRRQNGTPFWMEIRFQSIEVKGRPLVLSQMREITERKRYQESLSALHASVTELVGAERPRQVAARVVAAAQDILAVDHAAVYLHDPAENELELIGSSDETVLQAKGQTVPFDPEHPVAGAFIQGAPVEADTETVFCPSASVDSEAGYTLLMPIGEKGVLAIRADDSQPFDSDEREFAEILSSAAAAALGRMRKDTELDTNRVELERQTVELERLGRMNSTLRALNTTLLKAETREEVYDATCKNLGRIQGVKLAWVGVAEEGVLERQSWAGDVPQYLDSVSLDLDESEEPAVAATTTGSVVRIDNTVTGLREEPWRQKALAHGVESVLALPIEAEGITYGTLSVLSGDQGTFDSQFEELLFAIATAVGETIHSIEQRQGMQRPTSAELTFEIADDEYLFQRIAADAGCQIDVEGVVTEPEGRCRVFVTVDVDPKRARTVANDMAAVEDASVVATDGDGGRLELLLATPLLGVSLTEYVLEISHLRATADSVQVTLRVAQPEQVRQIADTIRKRYPEARLLSKRQQTTDVGDRERLLAFRESLTPRQREVLQTAYLSGYFDSPRACTGEELGERLGISAQAVYQHIRSAQRKLLDEAFRQLLVVSSVE